MVRKSIRAKLQNRLQQRLDFLSPARNAAVEEPGHPMCANYSYPGNG
jgi:hypothetical protein